MPLRISLLLFVVMSACRAADEAEVGPGPSAYTTHCETNADCSGTDICDATLFGSGICMAPCVEGKCQAPGYTPVGCSGVTPPPDHGMGCLLKCSANTDCPRGVDCQKGVCLNLPELVSDARRP